jgi:hypothetical protein
VACGTLRRPPFTKKIPKQVFLISNKGISTAFGEYNQSNMRFVYSLKAEVISQAGGAGCEFDGQNDEV